MTLTGWKSVSYQHYFIKGESVCGLEKTKSTLTNQFRKNVWNGPRVCEQCEQIIVEKGRKEMIT